MKAPIDSKLKIPAGLLLQAAGSPWLGNLKKCPVAKTRTARLIPGVAKISPAIKWPSKIPVRPLQYPSPLRRWASPYTLKIYPTIPQRTYPGKIPVPDNIPVRFSPDLVSYFLEDGGGGGGGGPSSRTALFDSVLVCLVFGRPTLKIAQDEIIPDINFWNEASGDDVHVFLIGLSEDPQSFDAANFVWTYQQFQAVTTWKYSGEIDVILLNAHRNPSSGRYRLDFSAALAFNLKKAIDTQAINSVAAYFQNLFNKAKEVRGKIMLQRLSDRYAVELIKEAMKGLLVSCLPESLQDAARKAFYAAIRDISKNAGWVDRNFSP